MNSFNQKRQIKKTAKRDSTMFSMLPRIVSIIALLCFLVFSLCAVGYVVFFRTVLAQEIPTDNNSTLAFEEPESSLNRDGVKTKVAVGNVVEVDEGQPSIPKLELPKVAIIIDDLGYDEAIGLQLLKFPIELTYSFLPFAPYTRKLERLAHRAGKTVFLHLPLEPKDSAFNPGPGALFLEDSVETQKDKLVKCLQEVPHAVGINNHMGSAFTENTLAMANIMEMIKGRSLLFVDSITTPKSEGLRTARAVEIKSAGRGVFLDNDLEETKICVQLDSLVRMSERNGWAIGIAHPRRATVNALLTCGDKYRRKVKYVSVREVL
ncbi:MAG: divergent polysaccharide deacetylase family protein [Desulforhopalus sp.]|nr:divergent polysaccharide deacetylase family protein [Desulforhopalus sp.]